MCGALGCGLLSVGGLCREVETSDLIAEDVFTGQFAVEATESARRHWTCPSEGGTPILPGAAAIPVIDGSMGAVRL
jgi:hypothetical protein